MNTLSVATSQPTPVGEGIGRAHAKVLLLGEHSVVYGSPAIALPFTELEAEVLCRGVVGHSTIESDLFTGAWDDAPDRLAPTLTAARAALARHNASGTHLALHVRSTIPPERGLGSSAAVAAATVGAVLHFLGGRAGVGSGASADDEAAVHELIQEAERVAHVRPSGIDAHAVVAATPRWFQAGVVESIAVGARLSFVVADTGLAGATRDAVEGVMQMRRRDPQPVEHIIEQLTALTQAARSDLACGDAAALGERMSSAHLLLRRLAVSSPDLDHLVAIALDAGALGAKLTGGGRGGCIIALAADDRAADVTDALRAAGAAAVWHLAVEGTR